MEARILELIKKPALIQETDLEILNKTIQSHPYLQVVRALQLLGTARFFEENYHQSLSTAAAYTTDKKILYQLINGKIRTEPRIEELSPITAQETLIESAEETYNEKEAITISLNQTKLQDNEVEITSEENVILTQNPIDDKIEKVEQNIEVENNENEFVNNTSSERNIESQNIDNQVEIIENTEVKKSLVLEASEINFQGTSDFLPNVKIEARTTADYLKELPKPKQNRHEEEMRRLIEEVERKMKEKRATPKKEIEKEESAPSSEISFAENMEFETKKSQLVQENIEKQAEDLAKKEKNNEIIDQNNQENLGDKQEQKDDLVNDIIETSDTEWKPMNFLSQVPDSTILKVEEKNNLISEEPIEPQKKEIETKVPEMSMSFFAPNISEIKTKDNHDNSSAKAVEEQQESNVPKFINTWQNWLKIDREQTPKENSKQEVSKEDIKEKAIEKFIENEPKISQLKEESNYIIKEKKGDISHLMTETLAKLYTEQKLYSKAIKAYETLSIKYPEKALLFSEKIKNIKEIRSNNQQQ